MLTGEIKLIRLKATKDMRMSIIHLTTKKVRYQPQLSSLMPRDRVCSGNGDQDWCVVCGNYGYTHNGGMFIACPHSVDYIGPGCNDIGIRYGSLDPKKRTHTAVLCKLILKTFSLYFFVAASVFAFLGLW